MKPIYLLVTLLLFAGFLILRSAEPEAPSKPAENRDIQRIDAFASVIYELASERYRENEKRNETWILSLHDWRDEQEVLKYSDGKYLVASLPVVDISVSPGMCLYVGHYNAWNLKAADLKVKAGDFKTAREIYELLLHFDTCGVFAKRIQPRLEFLSKIERNENAEENLRNLMDLHQDLGAMMFLGIDDAPTISVTNLLAIPVEKLSADPLMR